MEIPATAAHFIAVIVIALPGVTYATVRNRARGLAASSLSTASKLGEGLAAGVIFDIVYLWIFGENLVEIFTLTNDALPSVSAAARTALVLGVLVPAGVAWSLHRGHRWTRPSSWSPVAWIAYLVQHVWLVLKWLGRKSVGGFTPAFSSIPRAWDFAAPVRGEHFIRIETVEGKFFGGWFSVNSFVSTYPEPHDIFVERQWRLDSKGRFLEEVAGSNGLWYAIQPGDMIDWINPHDAGAADPEEGPTHDDRRTELTDGRRDAGQSHPASGGPAWG